MVSAYQQFVKEHIHQFKHLPAKERMKAVAQLYKKGSEAPAMKKGRGRPKKGGAIMSGAGVDGGSFLGDMVPFGNMLGLGLENQKEGGSFLGDMVPFGHMMGLGLDGAGMPVTGAGMKKGRGRPKKGGAMVESPTMSGDTGAGFGDWFFKGLTAPFALASKIPLPGLQQIGQAATKGFNAIGAPTLF